MVHGWVYALTIEEGIEIVVVHLTELEEVETCLWAKFRFEIYDNVTERGFKEDGHGGRRPSLHTFPKAPMA